MNVSVNPPSISFFTSATFRTETIDQRKFDKFTDSLGYFLKRKQISYSVFETGYRGDFRYPRYFPSKILSPFILHWIAIKSLFLAKFPKELNELKGLDDLYSYLKKYSDLMSINDFRSLLKRALLIKNWSEYLKEILKKEKPKLVFLNASYGPFGMAICLASRELGITSVDVQHGVSGKYHFGYGSWHNVPQNTGYEVLPRVFWTWTKFDYDAIREWTEASANVHEPIVGGNPFLSLFKIESSLSLVEDARVKLKENFKSQWKNVLITLQPHDKLHPIQKKIIEFRIPNVRFWIRLHPDMKREEKEILRTLSELSGEIETDLANSLPLYTLLECMNLHITSSSATVFEAQQFGVHTLICDSNSSYFFEDVIKEGMASVIKEDEISEIKIKEYLNIKSDQKQKSTDIETAINTLVKKFV
ncbi:hypothetical protein LPTSP4_03030 [Leptospira ryugenii]|uniref:Uncharacterized protein n=2 Tax=Leptospira ryugenii TaxID=1917863 RepID=A0A2P2DVZ8_9LEPT|nr:hypothetical protein LPTSP4_03030 [Leptospira ryugenii]